ncbi:sodium:pantothenate symporter [Bacillus sp. AFS015802]|uniref:YhdT family protein n=1 Tax=Bacillus sp. AFS015802 TaxID=2033486 RepID=UPI000BF50E11|nr:YhdT family protein [Bacillus sp. AFS015802]PFA70755.1 sodium:pantothenate symporter [Bacillus sp. AFS015802]
MNHKEDKRFRIANHEALIGVALVLINFLWWYGFAFGLGGQPVSDYDWILGMPAWFFYSCILGFLLMVFLVIVVVRYFLTDIPFDVEEDDHE